MAPSASPQDGANAAASTASNPKVDSDETMPDVDDDTADVDAEIDTDPAATAAGTSSATLGTSTEADTQQTADAVDTGDVNANATLEAAEARIAQKKDMTLREFLGKMDDYAPIIPDALTAHYLTLAGLPPPPQTPLPLARLLALATQKFVADIAADAYQYARIRSGHSTSNAANAGLAAAAAGIVGVPSGPGPASGAAGVGAAGAAGKGMSLGAQRPGFGGGGAGGSGASGAGTGVGAGIGAQGRTVLTMEDLGMAVGEYGVNVKRGEFYR